MRVTRTRRSWIAVIAAVVVAVPVFVIATAVPAGAIDVANATDLASNFNNGAVTSITMTADITIDCGHLLDRTSANALTLDGGGHTLTQGCATNRVMRAQGGGGLTVQNITVTGGDVAGNGGGVLTDGALTITGSTFFQNHAEDSGGGAYASGNITVTGSHFEDNIAGVNDECACSGGGFYTEATAIVTTTSFLENSAGACEDCGAEGGAFFAGTDAIVIGSLFTNNESGSCESCGGDGGAIFASFSIIVTDSLFLENHAGSCDGCSGDGGAIWTMAGGNVTGSSFTSNHANDCGEESGCNARGGAIFSIGPISVTGSAFSDNNAGCDGGCTGSGGAVWATSGASTNGSVFQDNSAGCSSGCSAQGGAIFVSVLSETETRSSFATDGATVAAESPTALLVSRSSFTNNETHCSDACEPGGGAIATETPDVAIDHSTFASNSTPGTGGALVSYFGADVTVTNSTVTENRQGARGALVQFGDGSFTLAYSTVVDNTTEAVAPDSVGPQAAVDSANLHADGAFVAVASVVALPNGGTNCSKSVSGTQTSQGYNFADDLTCGFTNAATGDRQGAGLGPIALGPLSDNGGVGQTMLPLAGSPLLDFIPPSACQTGAAAGVTDDERGVIRPQGPGCEIGAAEVLVAAALQPNFTG
jgi:hypothetical protein